MKGSAAQEDTGMLIQRRGSHGRSRRSRRSCGGGGFRLPERELTRSKICWASWSLALRTVAPPTTRGREEVVEVESLMGRNLSRPDWERIAEHFLAGLGGTPGGYLVLAKYFKRWDLSLDFGVFRQAPDFVLSLADCKVLDRTGDLVHIMRDALYLCARCKRMILRVFWPDCLRLTHRLRAGGRYLR